MLTLEDLKKRYKKKALIVFNFQRYLADPHSINCIPNAQIIRSKIEFLITEYKAKNYLVIGVSIWLNNLIAEKLVDLKKIPKATFLKNEWNSEYVINPNDFNLMIKKNTQLLENNWSAFNQNNDIANDPLEILLKKNDIKEILLIGINFNNSIDQTQSILNQLGYLISIDQEAFIEDEKF